MLRVEELRFRYGKRGGEVLRGVGLTLGEGEIGVLLSVSRAGSAMARDERAEEARRAQQEAQEQTPFEGA